MCRGLSRSGRLPCPLRRNGPAACLRARPERAPRELARGLAAELKATRAHAGGLRGAAIHLALGHGGQLLVERFFLVEILLKQARAILPTELFRPGDQRTVARNLVVLDSLRRGDERGVENRFVLDFAGHILSLVDDAVDGAPLHHLGLFAMQPEDLLPTA